MAKLPDLETWAKEAGERGAQYALKYLEEEYGVSIRRLIELAQADREGRCIIAPVKPGEIAWGGHARFDPVLGETKNVIYPVILKGWWTGLKDYEYEPREFRFGDLYESYDAAEKALEGGKHG